MQQYFLSMAQQPNAGQGHHILDVSGSHAITHHSRYDSSGRGIGPSQRPLPENTQQSQESSTSPGRIRTRNPSKRSAADTRLGPLGHWDRRSSFAFLYFHLWRTNPRLPINDVASNSKLTLSFISSVPFNYVSCTQRIYVANVCCASARLDGKRVPDSYAEIGFRKLMYLFPSVSF